MTGELRALLGRHLPGFEVRSVRKLGEGLENAAYEVNGGLILRRSKETDPARRGEATRREADLLAAVSRFSTLPVPEPLFFDAEAGVVAYPKLPGLPLMEPLMERTGAEPARLAPVLGGFLDRLHRAPVEEMEKLAGRDDHPLPSWLEDAERDYQKVATRLPATARRSIEDFLGLPPPAEPGAAVFCHNDLGTEHILVDVRTGAVTGVIDWTDAAVADPAHDFAPLYRDLGPDSCGSMLEHYGRRLEDADLDRVAFYARCSLIEDIAFGIGIGARIYADNAIAHLDRTFA